jgi:hypothetical protein
MSNSPIQSAPGQPIEPQRVDPQQVEVMPPPRREIVAPPLHVLSSLTTVALDWVWFMVELPATLSVGLLPTLLPLSLALGMVNLAAVTLIQHFLDNESWGVALAKGVAMGIISGVPYPVFGTAIGAPLALWGGFRELQKLLSPKNPG